MKILLDNCVNHRFSRFLTQFEVVHAREMGWAELSNGRLMSAAEENGFDVLLTVDQSICRQQNVRGREISLVTLDSRSIVLDSLVLVVPELEKALDHLQGVETNGLNVVVSVDSFYEL